VLDLARPKSGGLGDVAVVGVYTAAHEGSPMDHSMTFTGSAMSELEYAKDGATGEPRWVVYSSQDKHATYVNIDICESVVVIPLCIDEDCGADGVSDPKKYERLPPIVNAGEDKARLVTDLTKIGFPGDDAWADQKFCGGLGGDRTKCSSSARSKLLNDPFAKK